MTWFITVLKKYAVFEGRARRKEYWYFILVYVLVAIVLSFLDSAFATRGLLGAVLGLALLVPTVAVGVRRLHDTDRSGWWVLIGLIPFIGAIVLIIFFVIDSQPGANRFGPNPKSEAVEAT